MPWVLRKKKGNGGLVNARPWTGFDFLQVHLGSSGQVDMRTLQKLLTQNSGSMTKRYAHLRDDAMRRAFEVAGEMFARIGEEWPRGKVANLKPS